MCSPAALIDLSPYYGCRDATGQDPGDIAYLNNTPSSWRDYDWSTITTVDVFSNGSIDQELLCTAHEHGTRVVIGSAAQVQPMWTGVQGLKDPKYRAALVRSIVQNVQRERADGANVDIERPPVRALPQYTQK